MQQLLALIDIYCHEGLFAAGDDEPSAYTHTSKLVVQNHQLGGTEPLASKSPGSGLESRVEPLTEVATFWQHFPIESLSFRANISQEMTVYMEENIWFFVLFCLGDPAVNNRAKIQKLRKIYYQSLLYV